MRNLFFYLIAILFLFTSCKKNLIDYRNKYVGSWIFEVEIHEVNTQFVGYYHHDTIIYIGKIEYGDSKESLKIKYLSQNTIELKINKSGDFFDLPPKTNAEFLDKTTFKAYVYNGGLGGGISHSILGVKDNRKI